MGSVWITGDVITAARMNQKTILVDTGANINSATAYTGMMAHCTTTGSGFTAGFTYQYNGSAWILFGVVSTLQVVDVYSTTIGDYTTPTNPSLTSNDTLQDNSNTGGNITESTGTGYVAAVTVSVGQKISHIIVHLNGATSAACNIKGAIYTSNGSSLVAQTNAMAVPSGTSGDLYIPLTAQYTTVGTTVYVATTVDTNSALTVETTASNSAGSTFTIAYASFPPSSYTPGSYYGFHYKLNVSSSTVPNLTDGNTGTEWASSSSTHPYFIVDMATASVLTAAALYWDSSSTVTQILVQTSPDMITWTTVRTINTNLLTNGAWNYFRWDLPNTSLPRYVRFYGNDGTAKILKMWEVKIKQYANSLTGLLTLLSVHGHSSISSSDGTVALNA